MTAVRLKYLLALLAGAAVVVVLWSVWMISREGATKVIVLGGGSDQQSVADGIGGVSISGSLDVPLVPGRAGLLDLNFTNDHDDELVVTNLIVTVLEVSAPLATAEQPCRLDDFGVEQSEFEFVVPGAGSISLTEAGVAEEKLPRVTMLNTDVNQDGCKGALLALTYSAVGTSP